jgi:hypothetical protein
MVSMMREFHEPKTTGPRCVALHPEGVMPQGFPPRRGEQIGKNNADQGWLAFEGVKELFVVQCSLVICHFWMRLWRGIFNKKIARSATTDDK